MGVDVKVFIAELKAHDDRRAVVQEMRRTLRKAIPPVTEKIRAYAVAILPSRGGLGAWVAESKISASIKYGSRSAGVYLKGSRQSGKGKADLKRADAGQIRHPSWGRRGQGQWHAQAVPSGWFTTPARDESTWRQAADEALDTAYARIRG
jgi:hypothetical protein